MRNHDSKLPPGPLPDALCRAVYDAPEIHDPEPSYLDADGPHEPERVVSMGVEEAEREAFPKFEMRYSVADLDGMLEVMAENAGREFPPLTRDEMQAIVRKANKRCDHICGLIWEMLEDCLAEVVACRPSIESEARRA